MKYKWIRKSFLIAISLSMVGILFSCKNQNATDVPVPTEFAITFGASPKTGANIKATVDGVPIKNGEKVKKDKEVVFELLLKDDYTLDEWTGEGVIADKDKPMVARLKVSKSVRVTANLKETTDPKLVLKSLAIHHKDVVITNLDDVRVEVENFVRTLHSNDVVATFTYEKQKKPAEIKVKVDKNDLDEGDTVVRLNVPPVEGRYATWNQKVTISRKTAPAPNYVESDLRVEAIEVSLLNEKKKYEDYIAVENFNPEESGHYVISKDAKTAYVAVRVKLEKPDGDDYSIKASNATTYMKPTGFSRLTGENASYLERKNIALSKGCNVLEIKVENPSGTSKATYTVVVKYDGGPDPLDIATVKARKILPGFYCPAPRKPFEGESPDFVWLIGIAGW